jgi:hypothetical protein
LAFFCLFSLFACFFAGGDYTAIAERLLAEAR